MKALTLLEYHCAASTSDAWLPRERWKPCIELSTSYLELPILRNVTAGSYLISPIRSSSPKHLETSHTGKQVGDGLISR